MRLPRMPMQDPTGSMPGWLADTATLLRNPASRAMALISTTPLKTSGTSISNRRRSILRWLRDTRISGPLGALRTLSTKTLTRCPLRYRSVGTCSSWGKIACARPKSRVMARPGSEVSTTPDIMSPSCWANSWKSSSRSASRSRCSTTCLAVWAAMRLAL